VKEPSLEVRVLKLKPRLVVLRARVGLERRFP
jgi:hypothetical protein